MNNCFKVTLCHFHLNRENTLVVQGYFPFDNKENYKLKVTINGEEVGFEKEINSGNEVRRRYIGTHENVSEEHVLYIKLPENIKTVRNLKLFTKAKTESTEVFSISGRTLEKEKNKYIYNLDSAVVADETIRIIGWTASAIKEEFHMFEGGEELPIKVKRSFRKDVVGVYQELGYESEPGLEIELKKGDYKNLSLVAVVGEKTIDLGIDTAKVLAGENPKKDPLHVIRIARKIKRDGLSGVILSGAKRFKRVEPDNAYMKFIEKYGVSKEELEAQRETVFEVNPKFSIVVPMYKTPEKYLYALVDSVLAQTYGNFELVLADGSEDRTIEELLNKKYQDNRIVYKKLERNGGISDNTNQAIEFASGDFIVLSDHDDTLSPDALFECAKAINNDDSIDVLYSDEDKVSMEGDIYFDPSFKPDFNLDYLCSTNYICHLFVFKREVYNKAGAFRKEFDGAQDHDFILRCVEVAKRVYHIPKVLYHWRCHIDSTAMNLESKLYALDNGARAVSEHYTRIGVPAKAKRDEFYGTYHTVYNWEKEPLVSIIIPTKDHVDDLKTCIDSIEEKSSYRNFEFVIVENNSTEKETFEYYESIKDRDNVTIATYEGGFNFSAINNLGVEFAKGEMLLLLNNDTEIINADCIKEMVDVCLRNDVGACGALLYFPDDTIQHAGVVMGIGGIAGHTFVGVKRSEPGYMYRAAVTQDLTAVTAACLMIKKRVFEEIGGFTEELEVAFNDVDLCLKVRKAGYLVVFNPHAQLYHYESKSRGYEDSAEKQARFNREVEKLESLWPEVLKEGDEYYNPNLSLVDGLFNIKN